MNAWALEPISHSRSTLIAVVVAHVAAGLLAVQLFEARRYIDPAPLMVDLLPAAEQKADVALRPLKLPAPVREVRRDPEPVKAEPEPEPVKAEPEPIVRELPKPMVREAPKPVERTILPEPAPEPAPPMQVAPAVPVPLPPEPVPVFTRPEPEAITVQARPVVPDPLPPADPIARIVAVPVPSAVIAPVPAAPVAAREPAAPAVADTPEITMTGQMLTAAYLRNPKPSYPGISRRQGEQGTVWLRVFVTAVGDPTRVELKTSSGYPRLDQSARDAVQRWKFVPAKHGEKTVDAWVVVPIRFSLKG